MIARSLFDARLEVVELFAPMRARTTRQILVRLTRQSSESWPAKGERPVHLSYHWLDRTGGTVIHDGLRTAIPEEIPEAHPIPLVMDVETPSTAGDFRLRLTLVQENVAWFEERGFEPIDLDVAVAEPDRTGLEERRLRQSAARYRRILSERRRPRPYRTWAEYLRWSMLNHEFHAPFGEADLHVIATLESHANRLAQSYRARARDRHVSVIMPALNRAGVIRDAVSSVLGQSYTNWELIVVDDGSSDGTGSVAEASGDRRIRVVRSENTLGPSAARNVGLRHAKGSVVAYLDSDNVWLADYLLVMVNALADWPRGSGAYCAQRLTERFKAETAEGIRYGPFSRALLENINFVDISAIVHDRAVLERVGGFDERLDHSEDWDLVLRSTVDQPLLAVPALLSLYRYDYTLSPQSDTGDAVQSLKHIQAALVSRSFRLPITGRLPAPREAADREFFPAASARRLTSPGRFVTIVVPSFEAAPYLDVCLQAITAFTPPNNYEVVVVDNHSGTDARAVIERHRCNPAIRAIENDRNFGFTYAINQGIAAARPGSDVVILNNDALVTPGWLEALQEVVQLVPDAGIVVPRQVVLPGTETMRAHVPDANVGHELDVNLSDHHGNVLDPNFDPDRGFVELTFAPFFCAYVTGHCVREIGLLDWENGRHYRSDRIYCDRARDQAALRVVYTPHSKVYHFLQRSTADLRKQVGNEYQELYVENRWNGRPPPTLTLPAREAQVTEAILRRRGAARVGSFERFTDLAPLTEPQTETVREFTKLYCDLWNHGRPGGRGTMSIGWLGTLTQKSPFDLWTYQEMVVELRPDLIVECGTCYGGSGLFLASICELIGQGRVVTIDIVDVPGRPSHPRLQYVLGSSVDPAIVAAMHREAEGCGRVIVILDSDHTRDHVLAEMRAYADLVTAGSYLIVEDGIVNGRPYLPEFGPGPGEAIEQFLQERPEFVVDRDRERFLMTHNPGGYLRRRAMARDTPGDRPRLHAAGREHLARLARELIDLDGVSQDDGTQFPNHLEPPMSLTERRTLRVEGRDWPARALTMVGLLRLEQLREAIETVVAEDIAGDIVEAGVWRGGACILARATLRALNVTDRTVWCVDSFAGLPPPDVQRYPIEEGDTHYRVEYLKVGLPEVQKGFERFGELDDRVKFLPGWFAETLTAAPIGPIAVLRLDADMYGSTTEALRHLYPRVTPGGFVIVDDYGAVRACRHAVDDYREAHGIAAPLEFIDGSGRFWRVPRGAMAR